jgi:Secretion system C-terminal sorting domain
MKSITSEGRAPIFIGSIFLLTIFAASPFSGGAPSSRTGAPGDAGTCSAVGCHDSFGLNSGSGSVTIAGPDQYVPGQPLDLTVRVADGSASRFGFQISVRDASNNHVGTWVLTDTNSEFASTDTNYVTHDQAPFVTEENTWTLRWTPPAVLTADVTFYAAGNAANGNGNSLGDNIYTTTKVVTRGTATGTDIDDLPTQFEVTDVFPNPFVERATISYTLPESNSVRMLLYDVSGRRVRDTSFGVKPAGKHRFTLDAGSLTGGVYFYRLESGGNVRTGSVFLVR